MLKTEFARAYRIFRQATAITGVSEKNLEWGLGLARRKASSKDKWFPLGFPISKNANKDTILAIQPSHRFGIRKNLNGEPRRTGEWENILSREAVPSANAKK